MQFFAGANTRYGFRSIFDECFNDTQRIFILKGSSGCGKSTLMRRIAGKAKILGYKTDIIYCSADPDSLDGVIIPELGIAVADGTSPHTMDVKYPCVRESIVNLGQFWNENKLLPQRENIIFLTNKKSKHYKNAYRCLAAVGELEDIKGELIMQCTDRAKAEEAAFGLAESLMGESRNGALHPVFASAFTAAGDKTLSVFESVKTLYRINGSAKDFFMKCVMQIAKEAGADCVLSYSPIRPDICDAVYFRETDALVTSLENPPCAAASVEKTFSCAKFTDNGLIGSARARLRGIERLVAELKSEAQKEFAEAKAAHNAIESIYIPAMDFAAMDEFTLGLIENIFSA